MKLAIDVPNFGAYADPAVITGLARDVEEAGWDGLSLWDHILYFSGNPVGDPWVLLTAAAAATERIKLMSMVTPLPRRRPWVLARQCVTLDHLSGGRLILGVGIGYPPEPEFAAFGEETDERTRADMLDEGLAIITGMWSGRPFGFDGAHYKLDENVFEPTPVQQPRIPIWVAGMWPFRRPFRRAAQWDGVAPILFEDGAPKGIAPEDLREILSYVEEHRTRAGPYDVVIGLGLPRDPGAAGDLMAAFGRAGATWMRIMPDYGEDPAEFRARIRSGPPS